jgi:hypothetical protein
MDEMARPTSRQPLAAREIRAFDHSGARENFRWRIVSNRKWKLRHENEKRFDD